MSISDYDSWIVETPHPETKKGSDMRFLWDLNVYANLIFIFFCLNVLLRLSHFQSDINIRVDGFSSIRAGDAFTEKKVAGPKTGVDG